jgi:hypothetical protein
MGFQPRIRSRRTPNHEYTKPLREKRRPKQQKNKLVRQITQEDSTAQAVSQGTLKRLHNLGKQRFGSSPFSDHVDRWLANVLAVLSEFESDPNIMIDDSLLMKVHRHLPLLRHNLKFSALTKLPLIKHQRVCQTAKASSKNSKTNTFTKL